MLSVTTPDVVIDSFSSSASSSSTPILSTSTTPSSSSTPISSISTPPSSIHPPSKRRYIYPWPCAFDIAAARSHSADVVKNTRASLASRSEQSSKTHPHDADVLVIGGGIAGCALAVTLGKQGRRVIMLENGLDEPDRIVGELLQPGGVKALKQLGLEDCIEGIDGIPTYGYLMIYQSEHLRIPYPLEEVATNKVGRAQGVSFHHGRFIQKLRAAVQRTPNVTIVEATVNVLLESEDGKSIIGVTCTPAAPDGTRYGVREEPVSFFAPLTFAVNGYDSFFRKRYLTTEPPQVKSKFWGAILYDVTLPRPEHGHVFLGRGKPVLVYQIGESETRILVDVPLELPESFSKPDVGERRGVLPAHRYLRRFVLPNLQLNLQAEFRRALDESRFRSMPNSWLPPKRNITPGLAFVGDALNMRHPLTGGGMTVAFKDVVLLSSLLDPAVVPDFTSQSTVLAAFSTFHSQRKAHASVVNTLAQALYSVFADSDEQGLALREGCFDYILCGEERLNGPVSLLSGLATSPSLLIYHFFGVAFHAIWIASWKTAANWTGTGAFFNQTTPGPQFLSGGGGMNAAARAAGCPAFAGEMSAPSTQSSGMPSSHPSIGEGMDMSAIPAECPMSSMYKPATASTAVTSNSQTAPSFWTPTSYSGLILACLATFILFPIAWLVNSVPLLYRACVVIGPVIIAEIFA